jgi:hypothetical protein
VKYTFLIRYEIDAPLAISVAAYLDCEHYEYLHDSLTKKIEILEHGSDYYKCRIVAHSFGLDVGQIVTARYVPPGTFAQFDIQPFPRWWPSIHHLICTQTTLRYFETPERKTTLSELTVEIDLPFWLYPFRKVLQQAIERVKILKDLEDVAMIERRAKLFGRMNNDPYLREGQILLHKKEYLKYFGRDSQFYGDTPAEYRNERWPNIKSLNRPYVRRALHRLELDEN